MGEGTQTQISSNWKMHLDQLDLNISRPFYQGTHLTVAPISGLRALWIHQSLNLDLRPGIPRRDSPPSTSKNHSHSWALGPKFGLNSSWLFCRGLRLDGIIGSSLLYTRYTSISNHSFENPSGIAPTLFSTKGQNIDALRTTLDLGLGMGYSSYLFRNKFFFDLAVRYDFNQYFSQNMMRNFVSQLHGQNNEIGDLFLHGLTIDFRIDF